MTRQRTFRILAGVRGDINETWRYDASYQYAEVDMRNRHSNYVNVARAEEALLVNPDGSCASGSEACVPWRAATAARIKSPMQGTPLVLGPRPRDLRGHGA